jgi:hypothetical protein
LVLREGVEEPFEKQFIIKLHLNGNSAAVDGPVVMEEGDVSFRPGNGCCEVREGTRSIREIDTEFGKNGAGGSFVVCCRR